MMDGRINVNDGQSDRLTELKNKTSKIYGNRQASKGYNPFLRKNGQLVNPYIDYQRILDNSGVTQKAKDFIQQATGLTPTVHRTQDGTTTGYRKSGSPNVEANSNFDANADENNLAALDVTTGFITRNKKAV